MGWNSCKLQPYKLWYDVVDWEKVDKASKKIKGLTNKIIKCILNIGSNIQYIYKQHLKKESIPMSFFRWSDIIKDLEPGATLPAGMSRQSINFGDVMLALHEAFPNLKCKPHTHESAQISYMLKGKLRMRIGNEVHYLIPGEMGYVPPNVEHSIESLDEYVLVLDLFFPPRPDIAQRMDELEEFILPEHSAK